MLSKKYGHANTVPGSVSLRNKSSCLRSFFDKVVRRLQGDANVSASIPRSALIRPEVDKPLYEERVSVSALDTLKSPTQQRLLREHGAVSADLEDTDHMQETEPTTLF